MTAGILVVDDEAAVRRALQRALRLAGYEVRTAADAFAARALMSDSMPDAVVLDVRMPSTDGVALCEELRREGVSVPILMLTGRSSVMDRVDGLEAGADDYLVKPFALEELLARLRALLRRSAPDLPTLRFADLSLDTARYTARRGERAFTLTRTEFELLHAFMRNAGRVLTRAILYEQVWGYDPGLGSNPLEVYVRYLRRKTEAGGEPRLIHTVRGVGYVLRDP